MPFIEGIVSSGGDIQLGLRLGAPAVSTSHHAHSGTLTSSLTSSLPSSPGVTPAKKFMEDGLNLTWIKMESAETDMKQWVQKLRKLKRINVTPTQADSLVTELEQLRAYPPLIDQHSLAFSPPSEIFDNWEIRAIELTANKLTDLPEKLSEAKDLLVLRLGANDFTELKKAPFQHMPLLQALDLSENHFKNIPSWLPILENLTTLDVSHNPLGDADMTPLFLLPQLTRVNLAHTLCFISGIKPHERLVKKLEEVDLSGNDLTRIPDTLFLFKNLKILNLANNKLTDELFPEEVGERFPMMEVVDLSTNLFYTLPSALCQMVKLKKILMQGNSITAEGLPRKLGKLKQLEKLNLASNKLDTLPVFVCRINSLTYLNLKNNQIETLPVEIYLLKDNIRLELTGNPQLQMPPRPKRHITKESAWGEFSPKKQDKPATPSSDEAARKDKKAEDSQGHGYKDQIVEDKEDKKKAALMLKAMQAQAGVTEDTNMHAPSSVPAPPPAPSVKSLLQRIERPKIDYSDIFDDEIGHKLGMKVFVIDNLKPIPVSLDDAGKFCVADTYIVLLTRPDLEARKLEWDIFIWVGDECTLDKQTCGAIHAVNLRNHIGANKVVIRESQGVESPAFRKLFPSIQLIDRSQAHASGLKDITIRNDRVHLCRVIYSGSTNRLEEVAPDYTGLKTNEVFLLLTFSEIFLWMGPKSPMQARAKGRFVGDSIHSTDYKSRGELQIIEPGSPAPKVLAKFWEYLGGEGVIEDPEKGAEVEPPRQQFLFSVVAGKGFVDMPLVKGKLSSKKLKSTGCYILDSFTHVSLWIGKDAKPNYRSLCWALTQELFRAIERPSWSYMEKIVEGTETEVFKLNFKDWITVIKVDHANYLHATDANAKVKKMAVDVQSIYTKPPLEISEKQSKKFIREANESLKSIQGYVLSGGNFKKIPPEELGLFYDASVYVFMCSYFIFDEDEDSDEDSEEEEEDDEASETKVDYTIYFWEGKHASQMGWLKFKFGFQGTLENEIKRLFKKTPKIVRTEQQKEPAKLLAHFNQKIVIKNKERPRDFTKDHPKTALYRIHCGLSHVHFRAVEVQLTSKSFVSADIFALTDHETHTINLWQGKGSRYTDIKYASSLVPLLTIGLQAKYKVEMLNEGQEPNSFWKLLGGKLTYPSCLYPDNTPMRPRFWKCSNSTGFFKVTEIIEFCQDDLVDDDVIFMDCGPASKIYLWIGPRSSTLELSFAKRTVQAYLAHFPEVDGQAHSRTFEDDVISIRKNHEPEEFKAFFVGWDKKVYKTMDVGNAFLRDHTIPWGKVVDSWS